MGILSYPQERGVKAALSIARGFCRGHIIDGAPALKHAIVVVQTVERFVSPVDAQVAAGILLHDTPYFTSDRQALQEMIEREVGKTAAAVVACIEAEHRFMGQAEGTSDDLATHLRELVSQPDLGTLYATIADKITSFTSILHRSEQHDSSEFWRARKPLALRLPYFRQVHTITAGHLPPPMAAAYDALLSRLEREIAAAFEQKRGETVEGANIA